MNKISYEDLPEDKKSDILFSTLKNPFGIRDEKIILISDILPEEKGLKCNCVCPLCHGNFSAKLGDKRAHHFAHDGKSCNETDAFLSGFYLFIKEYFDSGNPLILPPLVVYFDIRSKEPITHDSFHYLTSLFYRYNYKKETVFNEMSIVFSETYIQYESGVPYALIGKKNGSTLAITVTPPKTVCKNYTRHYHPDFSTLEIDLTNMGEIIYSSKKNELFEIIKSKKGIIRWIKNDKAIKCLSNIEERRQQYIHAIEKKEFEEQKRIEEACQLYKRSTVLQYEKPKNHFISRTSIQSDNEPIKKKIDTHYGTFDQKILCVKCGRMLNKSEFAFFGGETENGGFGIGKGICEECSKKIK